MLHVILFVFLTLLTSASLTTLKPLAMWIRTNCGKFLKRWEYQTTLPASWETYMQVKKQQLIGHGTTDWFQIGKGVHQGCVLSPCLFNFYAEYIMWSARMAEPQARIKIAGRNINNLRYADDTTLMAESEEELKSLLMKVKEESGKSWLKTQHSKNKDHGIQSHHFMANGWRYNGNSEGLYFLGLQNHCRWWLQPQNENVHALWKESYDRARQHIKKQRHYFASKGPSSQSYGFSSSQV